MTDFSSARHNLERGRQDTGLGIRDLWLNCFGMGFNGSVEKLQGIFEGTEPLTRHDYDLIAQCLNEHLMDHDLATFVPYGEEIED